ncbi:amino acid ABC transporter ATP-binding protein [Labrys wisconsinensis]|uniref:Polar amino acid transport system ATP-binding protein n=1 Tax=Labrys wisconsinensis TaxID=425677 RepID=A0ABU0JHZ4_9HYPH|nr:amino acid ABC transporter ATP-binding protein [Labrys wisconsinensis]MDQ0473038.1 polar amino acid transport system ATP-binding protein [Labrys wisconsinensis]
MASEPLLSVRGLRKSYGAHEVLRSVSFNLDRGERVAIIGPSGSGKSTCLRAINYLEPPIGGEIRLNGELIGRRAGRRGGDRRMTDAELAPQRAQIGMVFQLFHLWPHLTVRENVALQPHKVQGLSAAEAFERADAMLAKVHLLNKSDDYPSRLSGGQQQRVAIARALAQAPALLLFDEPTSALDPELVGEVLTVIQELAAEGRSMLLVTHEIAFAREVADRVIFMDGGVIVEEGPARAVLDDPREPRLRRFLQLVAHSGEAA